MKTSHRFAGVAVCALLGCVEPFRGSYVELLFERGTGVAGDAESEPAHPELQASSLMSLYAAVDVAAGDRSGLLRITTFRFGPAVNPRSPCLIDAHGRRILRADCQDQQGAPFEDPSICEYWKRRAGQLGARRTGVFALVSASDGLRDAAGVLLPARTATVTAPALMAGADPVTAAPVKGLAVTEDEMVLHSLRLTEGGRALAAHCPPRDADEFCLDYDGTLAVKAAAAERSLQAEFRIQTRAVPETASPAQRLASCREDFSRNPDHYVANARQLTGPLSGRFYGLNKSQDPSSGGFLGGAEIVTDYELSSVRSMTIVIENRDLGSIAATPFYRLEDPGRVIFLSGDATNPARGRTNLRLLEPARPTSGQSLDVAVVSNLGDAPQQF